jgi:hypothetical protein
MSMKAPESITSEVLDLGKSECPIWDEFVTGGRSIHLEQTTTWGMARRHDGWKPVLVIVRRDRTVIGGAMVLTRRFGRFLRVGYVSRGPLVHDPDSATPKASVACVVRELQRCARRLSLGCLIVDPPYFSENLPGTMGGMGFSPHLKQLPPQGLTKGALIIDLREDEEKLLLNMRRSTRSVIKRAGQSSLVVRRGNRSDIPALWQLMRQLCERRGAKPNVSKLELIELLWDRLEPAGQVRIDVVESGSETIAALMTIRLGSWGIPWRIGWSGAEPRLSPEKYLYWAVIRDLKLTGIQTYDFNWIDPDEVELIRSGGEIPESTNKGITNYKMGFGGEPIRLDPPMDYFPSAAVRLAMRWGLGSLLNSKAMSRTLRRMSRQAG